MPINVTILDRAVPIKSLCSRIGTDAMVKDEFTRRWRIGPEEFEASILG